MIHNLHEFVTPSYCISTLKMPKIKRENILKSPIPTHIPISTISKVSKELKYCQPSNSQIQYSTVLCSLMAPGLSEYIRCHVWPYFLELANHQIRHQATHKVGCQPGDCIWLFKFSSGVCVGMYGLTLTVLNFWKFTSYCTLKPLWSGMGEVVPARTSPTLHPPSPPTVHQLSWLAF